MRGDSPSAGVQLVHQLVHLALSERAVNEAVVPPVEFGDQFAIQEKDVTLDVGVVSGFVPPGNDPAFIGESDDNRARVRA